MKKIGIIPMTLLLGVLLFSGVCDAVTIDNGYVTDYNCTVSLNKHSTRLHIGVGEQLIATVSPNYATNKNVIWTTSDPLIATVSETGMVTGISEGVAIIAVTTVDDGNSDNCAVTVSVPVDKFFAYLGDMESVSGTEDSFFTYYAVNPETGDFLELGTQDDHVNAICDGLIGHPTGDFLYAMYREGVAATGRIYGYSVNQENGELSLISGTPVNTQLTPIDMKITPDGKFLYVINGYSDSISVFAINLSTGALTSVSGSPFATGPTPMNAVMDSSGKYYYIGASGDNSIYTYSINSVTGVPTMVGSTPYDFGDIPYGMAQDALGRYLFVTGYTGDGVMVFATNSATGELTPLNTDPYITGSAPYDIIAEPTGKYLYVIDYSDNNVSARLIHASNGSLSTVTGSPYAAGWHPQYVYMDPTGRYLYIKNMGSGDLSMYRVDETSGALSPLSQSPLEINFFAKSLVVVKTTY